MFASDGVFKTAQPLLGPSEGMNLSMSGNQTTGSPTPSGLAPYNNPNLGFSLEYPTDWRKEEPIFYIASGRCW